MFGSPLHLLLFALCDPPEENSTQNKKYHIAGDSQDTHLSPILFLLTFTFLLFFCQRAVNPFHTCRGRYIHTLPCSHASFSLLFLQGITGNMFILSNYPCWLLLLGNFNHPLGGALGWKTSLSPDIILLYHFLNACFLNILLPFPPL